jgi:cysteine-S-conjugate beta-lyase
MPAAQSAEQDGTSTVLVHGGRRKEWTFGVVNPPVFHASTVTFDTLAELAAAVRDPDGRLYYGRRGTPTSWALEEALTQLEPGTAGTKLMPSGVSALAAAFLTVLQSGDHVLICDSAYEPTRGISQSLLKRIGVTTSFYDPLIGSEIASLMRPNTRAVLVESPGSLTFEVQDIPAIAAAAHAAGAVVIADTTWATPLRFQAFRKGVDLSVHALTKYVVGHADAMLGAVTATEALLPHLRATCNRLGLCAGPDDIFLGLRGLRTMALRLDAHEKSALKVAHWLQGHHMIDRVLHPALPTCPGHETWQRDFSGSTGLFSFVLKQGTWSQLSAMVDHMRLFKMGFSWGGYESLILPVDPKPHRTTTSWSAPGPVLRLHIGLETVDDLIADLSAGLDRFEAVCG